MGRPKGSANKITDEQKMWAARVDRMLAQGSADQKEGFDRLICKLLTTGAEPTRVALIRLMIPYRRGLPAQTQTIAGDKDNPLQVQILTNLELK
jgi:hypothetical protein